MVTTIIRNIRSADLAVIDDAASKKGVSREQFLRQLIHTSASQYFSDHDKESLEETLRKAETVIAESTKAINSFVAVLGNKQEGL